MSPLNSQAGLLVVCAFAYQVIGQDIKKTIEGCISDNVTLSFDLPEKKDYTVDSYIWYKQDVSGDPSFAKYTVAENKFEIYRDAQNRLLHNHNDPSQLRNLVLLNVKKSDESKYVLVINYVNVTQQTSEYLLKLSVKDLCFGKPEQVDGCAVSTCFTGENGNLTTIYGDEAGMTQTVNGYTVVRNCTIGVTVNYTCCNVAGTCKQQMFKVPEPVEETTVVERKITKDQYVKENDGSEVGSIAGVIVAVLVVIGVGIAGVLIYKKRQDKKEINPEDKKGEAQVMLEGNGDV